MSGNKYWLVVGSPTNWETAFKYGNIWGLKDSARQKLQWEQITEGDILIFYATAPVSGVIGYGVVKTKFKQDRPLWPKEVKENRVIWPLRFEFDVEWLWNEIHEKGIYWERITIGNMEFVRKAIGLNNEFLQV